MAGIKIRASLKDDKVVVKALLSHPMETGRRKDPETQEVVPAHFIRRVFAEHGGRVVFESWWGTGVSANPFISFAFKGGAKGETLKLTWVDNHDGTDTAETKIR